MKRTFALVLVTTLLGGCAIVPLGYGYRDDGYRRNDRYPERYRQDDRYYRGYGYGVGR